MAEIGAVGELHEHVDYREMNEAAVRQLPRPAPGRPGSPEAVKAHLEGLKPAPLPALVVPNAELARAKLRTAHRRAAEARAAHDTATRHLTAARAMIAILEADLERYAGLDDEIASTTAAQIKRGERIEIPAGLATRVHQRDASRNECARLQAGKGQLEREAGEAERIVGQAQHAVAAAVETMIDAVVGETLAELQKVDAAAAIWRKRLVGVLDGAGHDNGQHQARGLAARAIAEGAPIWPKDPAVLQAAEVMKAYRAHLLVDAEAPPPRG